MATIPPRRWSKSRRARAKSCCAPRTSRRASPREGEALALVLWPGVQYRTGQCFELADITRSAQRAGARVGFDLAHAIGNLPLALHDSNADFAAWCSYKYLNGGPGRHRRRLRARAPRPRRNAAAPRGLVGQQCGHAIPDERGFEPTAGAAAWQVSNPPVLSAAPLLAALEIHGSAGMARLRAKSLRLTAFLQAALELRCGADIEFISPRDPRQRGAQLSVRVRGGSERARAVHAALGQRAVVSDWREPDTIRMAPVPLYNSYADAWRAAEQFAAALGRA